MTRPHIRTETAALLRERSACLYPAVAAALCLFGARGLYALAARDPAAPPLLAALLLCGLAALLTAGMIGQIAAPSPNGAAFRLGLRRSGGVWRLLLYLAAAGIVVAGFTALGVWVTVAAGIERGASAIVRAAIWREAILRPSAELRWTFGALLALGAAGAAWFLPGAFFRAALATGRGLRGAALRAQGRALLRDGGRMRVFLRLGGLLLLLFVLSALGDAVQAVSSFSRIGDVPYVHLPMLALCIPQGFAWMLFWMSLEAEVKIRI